MDGHPGILLTLRPVPEPRGAGTVTTVALPPLSRTSAEEGTGSTAAAIRRRAALAAPVLAAVRRATATRAVPANLSPPLAGAAADKAPPLARGR